MVTFNCEVCNDTVPKKNTEKHYYRCPEAYYTCIDCNKTFDDGVSYKQHTQCITEDEKYQKKLFKGKKKTVNQKSTPSKQEPTLEPQQENTKREKEGKKNEKKDVKKDKQEPKKTLAKGQSLYKVLKEIKDKDKKKHLLKKLIVISDNRIELKDL